MTTPWEALAEVTFPARRRRTCALCGHRRLCTERSGDWYCRTCDLLVPSGLDMCLMASLVGQIVSHPERVRAVIDATSGAAGGLLAAAKGTAP